jgi:serine protease
MQAVRTTPLTPAQVESVLKSTLRAFPGSNDKPIGSGIIDANAAVSAAAAY